VAVGLQVVLLNGFYALKPELREQGAAVVVVLAVPGGSDDRFGVRHREPLEPLLDEFRPDAAALVGRVDDEDVEDGGRGWHVEVDHPDSGHVWTPDVVDAERQPRANGLPQLQIRVRKNDKWRAAAFEGATIRVWKDGQRQPIDEIESVTEEADQTVLQGRGGVDLLERVRGEVGSAEAVHKFAEDIIANDTPYTANVDAPQTTTETKTLVTASNNSALQNALAPIPDDVPLAIRNNQLEPTRVGYFIEAEDSNGGLGSVTSDSDYSGGEGITNLSTSIDFSASVSFDHKIPGSRVGYAVRWDGSNTAQDNPKVEFSIGSNSQVVPEGTNANVLEWQIETGSNALSAGSYTFTFDIQSSAGNDWVIDAIAVYDTKYQTTPFDNATNSEVLDNPWLYPDVAQIDTEIQGAVGNIKTGRIKVNIDSQATNDVSGTSQFLGLSFDRGSSFATGSQTESVPRTVLRARPMFCSERSSPSCGYTLSAMGRGVVSWYRREDPALAAVGHRAGDRGGEPIRCGRRRTPGARGCRRAHSRWCRGSPASGPSGPGRGRSRGSPGGRRWAARPG